MKKSLLLFSLMAFLAAPLPGVSEALAAQPDRIKVHHKHKHKHKGKKSVHGRHAM